MMKKYEVSSQFSVNIRVCRKVLLVSEERNAIEGKVEVSLGIYGILIHVGSKEYGTGSSYLSGKHEMLLKLQWATLTSGQWLKGYRLYLSLNVR
jgi:hypothetical protein